MASPATRTEKTPTGTAPSADAGLSDLIIEQKADVFAAKFPYQQHPHKRPSLELQEFAQHFGMLRDQARMEGTDVPDDAILWKAARVALDREYGDSPLFEKTRANLAAGNLPHFQIEEHDVGQAFFDIAHVRRDAAGDPKLKSTGIAKKNLETTRQNSQFLLKNLGIRT